MDDQQILELQRQEQESEERRIQQLQQQQDIDTIEEDDDTQIDSNETPVNNSLPNGGGSQHDYNPEQVTSENVDVTMTSLQSPTANTTQLSPTTATATSTSTGNSNNNSPQLSNNNNGKIISPTLNSNSLSPNLSSTNSATTSSANTTLSPTTSNNPVLSPTTSTTGTTISSVMPAIGKRLNVQIDTLEARITADKYDTEAWTLLLNEVQSQPITIARDIYERFLAVFPTAGRYWKLYVEQEMASKNYDMVEKIFLRSLRNVRNVELWKCYITYIRQIKGDSNKEEVIKAFELAIEYIGLDISSTSIWLEYLAFLKEDKATNNIEEGAKKNAIRKLYQRAIENPMHDLDQIWKEYEQFEQASGNKNLAKNLLTEHSTRYQHAKTVYRERKALLEGILRNMLARPPRASDKEEHQVRLWRKLIAYEKSNPQRFEQAQLRQRVTATYNQCLLCLYHYPDIWYEAAAYQADAGNMDLATNFYDRAIQAIPNNLFLHFSYADFLELNKKVALAKEVYERLVSTPEMANIPLVWIQYMRFARRTERIEGPRKIFKRAKSNPECTYHVYIALGFIEYFVNQDTKTAREIFELGLKKFNHEIPYVHFYVDFLTNLNEDNNTRVLFEKILSIIPADKSEIFWRKYLDFEYRQNQDINTIVKLEKRFQALSPANEKMNIMQVLNRYKFLNLWPCHPSEIEIINKNLIEDDIDVTQVESQTESTTTTSKKSKHDKEKEKDKDKDKDKEKDRNVNSYNADKPSTSTRIPSSSWKTTRPDTTLMIPYRNEMGKISTPSGGIGVTGNMGDHKQQNMSNQWNDIPEFIMPLLMMLPSPNTFQGPWINVDQLMMLIKESPLNPPQNLATNSPNLPMGAGSVSGSGSGGSIEINSPTNKQPIGGNGPNVAPKVNPKQQGGTTNVPSKRKVEDTDNDDTSSQTQQPPPQPQPAIVNKPPEHDIYRKRQASKLSKRS